MPPRLLAAAALLAGLASAPARAADAGPLPGHVPYGREACFGVEPAKAGAGRIASLMLHHDTIGDPQAEERDLAGDALAAAETGNGDARVQVYVRLRGRPAAVHRQIVGCRAEDGAVRCGVECDGGGFRLAPNGPALDLTADGGMVVVGGCGGPEGLGEVVLRKADLAGPHRLEPRPVEQCRAERAAWRPGWAAGIAPIRDRFRAGTECFARAYDKAHLAAHPKQKVAAVSLQRLPVEGRIDPEQFDLAMTITLRSGEAVRKSGRCSALAYGFSCIVDGSTHEEDAFQVTRAPGERIAVRDEYRLLPRLTGLALGADDRTFLLDEAPAERCAP